MTAETSPLAMVSTSMQEDQEGRKEGESDYPTENHAEKGEESNGKGEGTEEDSLVEVYSDRLCAVTHAFALCCSVLQKSSRRQVVKLAGKLMQ